MKFLAPAFLLFFTYLNAFSQTDSAVSEPVVVRVTPVLKCDAMGNPDPLQIENLSRFQSHHLRIFNRQGRLVFSTKAFTRQWPDEKAIENKYFYMLQLDEKRISGWIEIDRSSAVITDANPQ